jgi:hypothetical protein
MTRDAKMPRWSPSSWDKFLPEDLYEQAKDIGERVYARLCEEWTAYKINSFFKPNEDGFSFYLEPQEEYRILVCEFMDELPRDDPDIVAYNGLRVTAYARTLSEWKKKKNRRGRERYKERMRTKRLHAQIAVGSK